MRPWRAAALSPGAVSPAAAWGAPSTQIGHLEVGKDGSCSEDVSWVFWMGLGMYLFGFLIGIGAIVGIVVDVKRAKRVRAARLTAPPCAGDQEV